MKIPFHLIITSHIGRKRPMGRALSAKMTPHVLENYLVFYLLEFMIEKPAESNRFRPYLNILPSSLDDFTALPVTWTAKECDSLLSETSYAHMIQSRQRQMFSRDFNTFSQQIQGFSQFTYEQYLSARLIVLSRSFNYDAGTALVPLADMMNHENPKKRAVTWMFNRTERTYVVTADRHVDIGEDVMY